MNNGLSSLIFPHTCAICTRYIGENSACICNKCMHALPRTEQAYLRQNETEMILTGNSQDIAGAMKKMRLKRAAAFLFYNPDSTLQTLIHKMKYAEQPHIAYLLGRQAAIEFRYADFFRGIDVILPVPLHPRRLRERGYNQSEYIARGISDLTGIALDTTHVTRIRNTPHQALLKGTDREENVKNAFDVNHPEQMYHKHILLVDDLITTGQTMRACLQAMKQFKGASFSVFALCKTAQKIKPG